MKKEWKSARRIIVKIGSSLLVDRQSGIFKRNWFESLADDIKDLCNQNKEIIIVSSGAIALGRRVLGLQPGTLNLEESQASAATGQIHLAHAYEQAFRDRGLVAAQVLMTIGDTEERRRYLNARNTMQTLLKFGAIPVVNENDTVATSEIRYGDNDRLAARVASMMSCDCLVLLSDVDGLYTAPPTSGIKSERLDIVKDITPEIEAMAGDVGTDLSRGGMVTKIEAAKIATAAGANMVITSGKILNPLRALGKDGKCTWFLGTGNPSKARKRWIAGALVPRGSLIIDDGAVKALEAGKSLLPAGIVDLDGQFERGDAVIVCTEDGEEIGRGLTAYDYRDARRIIGHNSREISEILGYSGRSEIIHRDDLALKRK